MVYLYDSSVYYNGWMKVEMNETIFDHYRDITGFTIFQLGVPNSLYNGASNKCFRYETTDNQFGA